MSEKRLLVFFFTLLLLLGAMIVQLARLSKPDSRISQAAQVHGSYTLKLGVTRGTIYDTNMQALVNNTNTYLATVMPADNSTAQLNALAPLVSNIKTLTQKLEEKLPFSIQVKSANVSVPGIQIVQMEQRYTDSAVAPQIIGYTGSDGAGVSGIEKAFNTELGTYSQSITASFPVDANGRRLTGLSTSISATGTGNAGGVVLTIDKTIQQAAQKAADKYMKSGAVVVMNPANGDILASVSNPTFSQNDLSKAVSSSGSPLLNRAFSAYNLGSVFKIAVAATALEDGVSPDFSVNCTGSTDVAGRVFHDEKATGHGVQNMASGMANSCNVYYITLGQRLGGDKILSMAQKLGFGQMNTLAPGYGSAQGQVPTAASLKVPAALANFSIGQGDFMATPVQVARMLSAVANGGLLPTPRLVKSIVNNDGQTVKSYSGAVPDRVFSANTASLLRQFLIKTVNEGTGKPAMPTYGGAGGKTATAETGWVQNGKTINQVWFAGFYPAENPKYVIVVMMENGVAGGTDAGPVFKYVADSLASSCGYPSVSQ